MNNTLVHYALSRLDLATKTRRPSPGLRLLRAFQAMCRAAATVCLYSLLLVAPPAMAQVYQCSTTPGKITFDGRNLTVNWGTSAGSYLGGITAYLSVNSFAIKCQGNSTPTLQATPLVVISRPGSSAAGDVIRLPNTNIGLKFYADLNFMPQYSAEHGGVIFKSPLFPSLPLVQNSVKNVTAYSGATMFLNLIALGPIQKIERIPSGTVGKVLLSNVRDSLNPSDYLKIYDIEFTGDLVVSGPTCTVKTTDVALGTRQLSGNVGDTTPAVPFNIELLECPSRTPISYRLDPTTSIVSPVPAGAGQSVIALDGSSSATGVGIQLLRNDLVPLPLGTLFTLGVNVTNFERIQLRARYIKLSPLISPGTANSSATITLSYQ